MSFWKYILSYLQSSKNQKGELSITYTDFGKTGKMVDWLGLPVCSSAKKNRYLLEISLIIFLSVFLRDEIGLIPCPEARYNRSPIVLVENKLGVESWCVKFLLPYVHNKLLLYRQRKQWLNKDGKLPSWRIVSDVILNAHFFLFVIESFRLAKSFYIKSNC